MISFLVTPFILANNVIRYLLALRLPGPDMVSMNTPYGYAPPSIHSGSLMFKLIYGAVVCVTGLGVLGYKNVEFIEKHAPSLNATLHTGEISDAADAEYSMAKLSEDVHNLEADIKGKSWADYRSEVLSRSSSFT